LLADVFNLPISTGTLAKINSTFSDRIGNLLKKLKSDLIAAPVKHMDETGFRIEGRTQWLHVLCDETGTYYQHSPKRGAVFDSVKEGTVVHDHYRSYYKQLPKVKHALCNAHHLRELKALIEIEKESWAGEMWKLLNDANSLRQKHKGRVPQNLVEALSNRYDRLVQEGLAFHDSKPPLPKGKRGSRKRRIGHNLLRRFLHNKEDTLRFMYEAKVPFTNNQAERDIRMMKVQQKISGCFRTLIGASIFCRIKSFLSTVIKRGLNVLQAIRKALQNNFSYLTLSLYRQQ
jgi:transposase